MGPAHGDIIHYTAMGIQKQDSVSVAAEGTTTRDELPDEVMGHMEKKPVKQLVKLQKKGTTEVVSLAISEVGTWGDLLKALADNFPSSSAEPQITTFGGSLITSPKDYEAHLKPGLHLVVYFPPTVDELSQSLNTLFFENISSTTSSFKLSSNPRFRAQTPLPDRSQLADYLNSPTPIMRSSSQFKRYQLQPPTIYFHVSSPTPISITLHNSAFEDGYSVASKWFRSRDPNYNPGIPHIQPTMAPDLNSNYTSIRPGFQNASLDYTIMREDSGLPTKPSGGINMPPWSPFPIYTKVNLRKKTQADEIQSSPYRVISGGLFPVTSFDLFAQSQRKRVLCSTGWEVTASPPGTLVDLVSGKEMPSISWAVSDCEGNGMGFTRTSEKRIYANYEGPTNLENDNRDGKDVGWWMVGPGKLPTGFSGEASDHTFLLKGMAEVATHLRGFMQRCGISENIIEEFIKYWVQRLEIVDTTPATPHENFTAASFPYCPREGTPKLVLLKFLHPRDLRNLLPLAITPEPHRTVRLFAVFRVVEPKEMVVEGIDPCGDFETEVDRVLGGIGSCGGGWNCGHRGFKVAEVGGVRVFGSGEVNQIME